MIGAVDFKQHWLGARPILGKAVRHAVVRALILLAVLVINPFGIAEWSDRRSHDVWQGIYADHYGAPKKPERTETARNLITVVTLDKYDMASAAPQGMMPDSIQMLEMIRMLADGPADPDGNVANKHKHNRPRAIFVDLLLGDAAPDLLDTNALLARQPKGSCPRGLASDRSYTTPKDVDVSAFRCLLEGIAALTGYEHWKGRKECLHSELAKLRCILQTRGAIPILIADPVDPAENTGTVSQGAAALAMVAVSVPVIVDERSYPLIYAGSDTARLKRQFSLYPAAMLYAAHCAMAAPQPDCTDPPMLKTTDEGMKAGKADGRSWVIYPEWSAQYDPPVDVIWAIGTPNLFSNTTGLMNFDDCKTADPSMWATVKSYTRAFFSGIRADRVTTCIYQNHINYAMLRQPEQITNDTKAMWNTMLGDKIVMLGLTTPDSNDFVLAGPHQQLPGVYYHAMALDNLLTRGAGYSKPAEPAIADWLVLSNYDLWNCFAAVVMLLFGGVVIAMHPADDMISTRPMWKMLGIASLWMAASTLWMLLILYLFTSQVSLMPDQFNMAALSIVIVLEFIKIASVIFRPILLRLGQHSAVVRFLLRIDPTPARHA